MSARTPRRTVIAATTACALIGATIALGTATASAGGPGPVTVNVTRIDLGGATDALMLAPDGAGKVWFALPGGQTYGYVSGGTVTSLTNNSAVANTGHISSVSGVPHLWSSVNDPMTINPMSSIYAVGADDAETYTGNWATVRTVTDTVATAGSIWTSTQNGSSNVGRMLAGGGPCGSGCATNQGAAHSGITVDGAGTLWLVDSDSPDLRSVTPGVSQSLAETGFTLTSRVDKLTPVGTTLYASVPGQSVLRRIVPGTAPNVTETDQATSGVVGDVEADDDGNVWFSIAGQPKLGVRTAAGSVYEFATPAPARRLAYDASTDRLWWSESGTAKVAHMAANIADVTPTTTTTSTTTTTAPPTSTATTTTAPPATTTTTTVPPADTTAPSAPITGTTLRMDRNGAIRPVFGPASEPMAVIAQLRVRGVPVAMGGSLMPSGDTRPVALNVPRRLWPRTGRTLAATLVVATVDGARNVGLSQLPVTLTR